MAELSLQEKLAALRAAKEEDAKVQAEKAMQREVELLELEARMKKEHGDRGKGFELVNTLEGPIAVKLGEAVLHKRFSESDMKEQDLHDYVFPCVVHPAKEEFLAAVGRRPGILLRCANALATLFGAKQSEAQGKF